MKFALFLGCNIPARLTLYESSARAVLGRLDVGLVDIKELNCCGYPVRNLDFRTLNITNYIDCHCPRPYSSYKETIDQVTSQVLFRLDHL